MDNIKLYFVIFIIIILIYLILRKPKVSQRQHIHIQQSDNSTKLNQRPDSNIDTNNSKEIDKYFKMPTSCIPIDYPVKKIGDCPYSKPQSIDLPIAQVPMCFANKSENNMYLRE